MKKLFRSLVNVLILVQLLSCHSQDSNTLAIADDLYVKLKTQESFNTYKSIWENTSHKLEDRASSGRMLAKMTWLIYQNNNEAISTLKKLATNFPSKEKTFKLWARILAEEGRYDDAISKLKEALKFTYEKYPKMDVEHEIHRAILQKNMNNLEKDIVKFDIQEINKSIQSMHQLLNTSFGSIEYYRTLIGLSLLANDYESLLSAWLGFFSTSDPVNLNQKLKKAYQYLSKAQKENSAELTLPQIENLILGLAESGFIKWSAFVKNIHSKKHTFKNQRVDNFMHLNSLHRRVKKMTIAFYRATALGKENKKQYRKGLMNEASILWEKITWKGKQEKFDFKVFEREMRKRFGLVVRLYENNYVGLHLGQAIHDEQVIVSQHEREAKLDYILTDHMISNGYEPWFWDGKLTHTGWINAPTTIFQVRISKLSETAWRRVYDSETRSAYEARMTSKLQNDIKVAEENPYAYLNGLLVYLRHSSNLEFYNTLKQHGYQGENLKRQFVRLFQKHLDNGIIIHEGRHAIDKQIKKKWKSSVFEYRAKLSEIIFSEVPFFALGYGGIISPDTGGKSAHGKANLRILKGLVSWMEKNQGSIAAFDKNQPTLPQLKKLTTVQLKKAFRNMDPLFIENNKP